MGCIHVGLDIGEARGYRDQHTQYYETQANDEIATRCLTFEGEAIVDCVNTTIEAKNEQQRAESDLVVQTEMATWAFWMFVFTVLITAVTAVGVFFVWQTLKETQIMVADTRRIGEAQVRAYLTVEKIEGDPTIGKPVEFSAIVRNVGVSPAYNVAISTHLFARESTFRRTKRPDFTGEKVSDIVGVGQSFVVTTEITDPHTNKPIILTKEYYDRINSDNMRVFGLIMIEFQDEFTKNTDNFRTIERYFEFLVDHFGRGVVRSSHNPNNQSHE